MPIWLIQILVSVALTVVSHLIQQATAQQPRRQRRPARGFRGSVQTGGKVPLSFLVGTIGVPGKLEYRNTWGSSGGTPNANLVDVISFGDLPISGVVGLFVNSEAVTLSTTGHVDQGYPVAEKSNKLWWEFFDGTQTTANSYLSGKFGSDPDRPWESDMVGRGVPYLTLTARIDEKVWAGFPTFMAVMQGIPLYDVRKDSTAGGDGTHRWADQSTWEFSDNNLVIAYNILRGIHYDGERVWGGDAREYQLPYDVWAAAMDACDADFELAAGGTEKRFRAGREISFNERPAEVLEELLTGASSRMAYVGGRYYPLVGTPDAADGSFTDLDVIVTEATQFTPYPNLDQVVNGATATYLEPAQAWEEKETAPYYRSDLEAEDDDRQQLVGLTLSTTFSGTQAQRVIKAAVEESRRFARHVLVLPPSFRQYRPLQVLAWISDANSYEAKLFLITSRSEFPNGNVLLGLQEIDPEDDSWTPATDEQPLSFAPLTPILPPAQPMAGFAVSPYTFPDAAGSGRRPGILLEYTGQLEDVRAVQFEVREGFGSGNTVATGEITYDIAIADPAQPIGGQWTLPDSAYEVRTRFLPPDGSGRETEWSAWLEVTTPNIKFTSLDVDLSILGDGVLGWVGNVRSLLEQFKLFGTLLEEADRAHFTNLDSLNRSLSVKIGDLEASFDEIIEVAIGPGGAIATALEALYAAMGGNSAQVNVRWEAVAAPDGYSARYAITAAVDDGTFRSATFFLDVPADTGQPTRIGFMAGQTVFFTSAGTPIALMDEDGHFKSANGVVDIDMIGGAFSITVPD